MSTLYANGDPTTWRDVPLEAAVEVLRCVGNARGLYALEHFPPPVRQLVRRDFRRFYSGVDLNETILLADGTVPEAINAVMGYELALRIAKERGVSYEPAMGLNRVLDRIKTAVQDDVEGQQ